MCHRLWLSSILFFYLEQQQNENKMEKRTKKALSGDIFLSSSYLISSCSIFFIWKTNGIAERDQFPLKVTMASSYFYLPAFYENESVCRIRLYTVD